MQVLRSLAVLFFLCWVGDVIASFLPLPIPGSIVSMALLFALLMTRVLRQRHIQPVSGYLLDNMGILFLPSLVMVLAVWPVLRAHLFEIAFIGVVATIVTFSVTALCLKALVAWQKKHREARP